jgi:hypothetical protein
MSKLMFLLLAVGSAIAFGVAAFYIVKLPTHMLSISSALILQGVLSSICASFWFLFMFETASYIRQGIIGKKFRAFFGDLSDGKKAHLVYPDFVLSDQCHKLLKDVPPATWFRKHADHYSGTRFIDVPKIVASNDLQGIVILATRMGRYLGDSPLLITDTEAIIDPRPNKSLLSFGLTSNAVTDLYQSTDPSPLFTIEDPAGDPKLVVQKDGRVEKYGRDATSQHGLILRYRPSPDDYPTTFWIICAGLAAAGTPAAAWNLAHKWRRYHSRFGDKDFVIIFKTSNDVSAYASYTEVCWVSR